jgi:uncharacterized protein
MKIDVRKLKYSGKFESDFEFDYIPQSDIVLIPDARIDKLVKVKGSLELHNEDVYVDGTVECTIVGKCARCLEDAEYFFKRDFSFKFVLFDADEDDYYYKSGVVDLTDAINDVFYTEMVTSIYCNDDCKGLCPTCGANLNKTTCSCK